MGQKVDPRGYRVGVINDWNMLRKSYMLVEFQK